MSIRRKAEARTPEGGWAWKKLPASRLVAVKKAQKRFGSKSFTNKQFCKEFLERLKYRR
jgi:hypothetical protein